MEHIALHLQKHPALLRAAEFFAKLANKDIGEGFDFAADEREVLATECKEVCEGLGYEFTASAWEKWEDHVEWDDWNTYLCSLVRTLWRDTVWPVLHRLLTGDVVEIRGQAALVSLQGRTLVDESNPSSELAVDPQEFLVTRFYLLLHIYPFPFGQCQVCHKVFVYPYASKPRKYCSEACKVRGIPAATKRTEYARNWRHRVREQELATTRRILRVWSEERQYWPRLQKEFPKKSHRQLLYLLKQAQRKQENGAR